MTLGHHLCAQQNVEFARAKRSQNLFSRAYILHRVAVHTHNARLGNPFRQLLFKLFNAAAF